MIDINNTIANNAILLNSVSIYIKATFKITNTQLIENTTYYVRRCFKHLNQFAYKLRDLEEMKEQTYTDIKYLEASFVGSEWRTPSEEGRNTGGRKDNTLLKHEKLDQLKRDLEQYTLESTNIRKSFDTNKKMLEDFIELTTNDSHREILRMSLIELKSASKIAKELSYSYKTINNYKDRGIEYLSKLVCGYLQQKI